MDVAQIRSGLGMTQAELAVALGVSPGHVGDIERRHRKLTIKLAAKLESLSGVGGIVDEVVAEKAQAA